MSYTSSIITMQSGEKHALAEYESRVAEKVNAARGKGELIPLETPAIPTGQHVYIDPDLVESVKRA